MSLGGLYDSGIETNVIRKLGVALGCIVASAFVLAPAKASLVTPAGSVVTAYGIGVLSLNLGGGLANFNHPKSVTTYGNSSPAQGTFTQSGATFSGDGILMTNPTPGSSLGLYAEPYGDTTQYLTVQPHGPNETVTFGSAYTNLGLYWGSMDNYNSIEFYNGTTLLDTVTGTQAALSIPALSGAQGLQTDYANNRFITISNIDGIGASFTSIVLNSTSNSFELDNLSWGNNSITGKFSATPLPPAVTLFSAGLALLGFAGMRRRKAGVIAG
jgi:hypothetical protein